MHSHPGDADVEDGAVAAPGARTSEQTEERDCVPAAGGQVACATATAGGGGGFLLATFFCVFCFLCVSVVECVCQLQSAALGTAYVLLLLTLTR
jgi:hypothetical protein